ncbi:MAG: hypothetical protein ACU0CO_14535 [Shimia sp.]
MKLQTIAAAAGLSLIALPVVAEEVTISADGDGVTFVNLLTPNEGVTPEELAAELTEAMETEIRFREGFRNASVHIARDGAYVLNYAQWDSTENVDAVVAAVQAGELPEIAEAFTMSSPEFHPYDVVSVTLAAE